MVAHLARYPESRTPTALHAGKEMEQEELSFTAGGNAKLNGHYRRQFGRFL
jgi:hypothetical protein